MVDADQIPDTYGEWRALATRRFVEMKQHGKLVRKVPLRPETFLRYCEIRGIAPDSTARAEFAAAAMLKRQEQA